MVATPVSGVNLAFWNILPMGVSNYGGDLQVYNLQEYLAGPPRFNLNLAAQCNIATQIYSGIGGGWNVTPDINMGEVQALAQAWTAPIAQQQAGQQFSQANSGVTAIKTKLDSLLLSEHATTEDREKANEYLAKIDKLEKELQELKNNPEITAQEVFDKSFEIEKELRAIATNVGELATKVNQAAQQATQQAQQVQEQAQTNESQGISSQSATNSNSIKTDLNCELKPGLFKGKLAGHEGTVVRLSKKYGVSPALVASIIGLESGWGTSNLAQHNNFGGYRAAGDLGKNAKGFGYFSTVEKGLEAMIKNLASYSSRYKEVKAVDFNNLDAIAKH